MLATEGCLHSEESIDGNTEKQPQHVFQLSHIAAFGIRGTKKNSRRFSLLHGWINLLFIVYYEEETAN